MKKAMIAVAKNTLSRLIDDVKRGETVMIFDRDTPVARLEPVTGDPDLSTTRMPELVKRGIVAPPRKPLAAAAFLARPLPMLRQGASGVRVLLEEREAGR
jgi:antitoxin (DNA-binding transcriptional repressor) of toxin-antitoxin stability system